MSGDHGHGQNHRHDDGRTDKADPVELTMRVMGVDRRTAEWIHALDAGETGGDEIVVERPGKEDGNADGK